MSLLEHSNLTSRMPHWASVRIKFAYSASGSTDLDSPSVPHPAAAFEWLEVVMPGFTASDSDDLFKFQLLPGGLAVILKTEPYRHFNGMCRYKPDHEVTNHRLVIFNWQLGIGLGVCLS
jgi:hypothetical protein